MNSQTTRVEQLLKSAGVDILPEPAPLAPNVPSKMGSWTYNALNRRAWIYIYQFEGQAPLDEAIPFIEGAAESKSLDVVFAQNGEYLLAVTSPKGLAASDNAVEHGIDRILESFSGQEERP